MKALSIKQPWAWLICAGYKDVENRNWYLHMPPLFNYPGYDKNVPMRIYVHAGKKFDFGVLDGTLHDFAIDKLVREQPIETWTTGAIIGEVDIVGCKFRFGEENDNLYSPWHEPGMYGFILKNPTLYDMPIPCKGKLGFFEPEIEE